MAEKRKYQPPNLFKIPLDETPGLAGTRGITGLIFAMSSGLRDSIGRLGSPELDQSYLKSAEILETAAAEVTAEISSGFIAGIKSELNL